MTDEHAIERLLADYAAGQSSSADIATLEQWAAIDSSRRTELNRRRSIAEAISERSRPDVLVTAMAATAVRYAESQMKQTADRQPESKQRSVRIRRAYPGVYPARKWLMAMAGAAVVAIGITSWRLSGVSNDAENSGQSQMQQHVTARGQTARVTLRDGTIATLNAESRLTVSDTFGNAVRSVHVEGEVLLTVASGATPFLVSGGGVVTRVLGTTFSVRCYPGDAMMRVVVSEGKVSVQSQRATASSAVLIAGEMAQVSATGELVVSSISTSDYLGWVDGTLVYRKTPLRDVLTELSRVFNADIRVTDTRLGAIPVRTAVRTDERLDDVLSSLALSIGAQLRHRGTIYEFLPSSLKE